MTAYATALPIETDTKAPTAAERTALALKSMKASIDRRHYQKPASAHDKAFMHRLMGEAND